MPAFAEIFRFETLRMSRNVLPLIFSLGFPVMLLVIFGSVYGNSPNEFYGSVGTVDASVPAYMALVIAVTGLMSFPLTMAEYRGRGILRRLRMTPARPSAFLAAQLLVNAAVSLLGIGLLIATAVLFFDVELNAGMWRVVPALLLCLASIYAVGLLVASLAPTESAAGLIANLVYFPMIFLTGATIPLELLPDWLRVVSAALPLTYAVELLQSTWTGNGGVVWASLVLVAVGLVASVVAVRAFRWE